MENGKYLNKISVYFNVIIFSLAGKLLTGDHIHKYYTYKYIKIYIDLDEVVLAMNFKYIYSFQLIAISNYERSNRNEWTIAK